MTNTHRSEHSRELSPTDAENFLAKKQAHNTGNSTTTTATTTATTTTTCFGFHKIEKQCLRKKKTMDARPIPIPFEPRKVKVQGHKKINFVSIKVMFSLNHLSSRRLARGLRAQYSHQVDVLYVLLSSSSRLKSRFLSDSEILEFQNQNPARELSLSFDFSKMEGVLIHSNQRFLSNVMDQKLIYRVPIRSNKEIW